MNISQRLISHNFDKGRYGHAIKRIVLHTYDGLGSSLYNWFNNPTTDASAHYAVQKSGIIEQYVLDQNNAWHAGTNAPPTPVNNNFESIGIEHQDDKNPSDSVRTKELYESSAQLVASLCKSHGVPCKLLSKEEMWKSGIAPHSYYSTTGKTCPGGLDINRIIKRANEILGDIPTTILPPVEVSNKGFDIREIDTRDNTCFWHMQCPDEESARWHWKKLQYGLNKGIKLKIYSDGKTFSKDGKVYTFVY